MKQLFIVIASIVLFESCATTSGRISQSRDYQITTDTRIAVQSPGDPSFGASLEGELLGMGFEVVPYETAINALSANSNTSATVNGNSASINSNASLYAAKYIPSRIVLNVTIKLHSYPMATYLLGAYIRIIDLTDKKLLASFEYTGSEWTLYNQDDLLKKFVADFSKRIKQ
jgi:hypothetical protein